MYSHLKFEQSRHACRGRNEILIQVLIVVLTLLPWIPQTEASVGTVTKVQREENGSNIFQVNIVTCDVDACKSRNASLLGNEASGLDCRCRCEKEGVYSFHEDKCLSGGKESGSYVIRESTKLIPVFTLPELRKGGLLIKFCPDSDCVGNEVSNCKIISEQSVYDDVNGWQPLWKNENEVDFKIEENNHFKLSSNTTRYSGRLLKVYVKCSISIGITKIMIRSFAMFAVEGSYSAPVPPILPTTTEPTTSATTTVASVPALSTIHSPQTRQNTTKEEENNSLTTKFVQTTQISLPETTTTPNTTTTTPATEDSSDLDTKTTKPKTEISQEKKKKNSSKEDKHSKETDASNNNPQKQEKEVNNDSKMTLIIVTVLLGVFLIVSCILLGCFYQRWKKAKQRNANQTSDPPFFFQPQTPVFLIGRDGKQRRPPPPAMSSHFSNDLNESQRTTASETELCSHGNHGKPISDKRYSSIKHLYASIDKFLKFGNKAKSNSSLDEGYTTDDNYDYRRFAAFPKDLYDEPGSIVSSISEPDYKIPEDFETPDQMSIAETRLEDDYRPAHVSLEASILKALRDQQLDIEGGETSNNVTIESPYDLVKDELPRRERAITNPYDEVGEPLANKVNNIQNNKSHEDDLTYDIPEDDVREPYTRSNGKYRMQGEERVIENMNTLDPEYEGAVAV